MPGAQATGLAHPVGTVRAVHLHTFKDQDLAYNTVQTMLRLMTGKKLVSARLEGRRSGSR